MKGGDIYHSDRWKRKRAQILRRDKYRCRECARYGRTMGAATVHHMHTVEDAPQYAFASWNLLSLCTACHNKMHDRTTRALTARGLWWRDRAPPPPSPTEAGG